MRNYQYAWYLDNRFYITKNFVDEFIGVVSKIKKSGKEVDGSAMKPSTKEGTKRIRNCTK